MRLLLPIASRLALMVLSVLAVDSSARAGTVAATATDDGVVFQIDSNGEIVRGGDGRGVVVTSTNLQPTDLTIDRNGNFVVCGTSIARPSKGPRVRSEIAVFDPDGHRVGGTLLPPGALPLQLSVMGERIAVLVSDISDGWSVRLFDENRLALAPTGRVDVDLGCDELGLAVMSADEKGFWVAPIERCGDGYIARRYDRNGDFVIEVSQRVDANPAEANSRRDTFIPTVADIASESGELIVVLNRTSPTGVPVDRWSGSGEFLGRSTIEGLTNAGVRLFDSNRSLSAVSMMSGAVTPLRIASIEEVGE